MTDRQKQIQALEKQYKQHKGQLTRLAARMQKAKTLGSIVELTAKVAQEVAAMQNIHVRVQVIKSIPLTKFPKGFKDNPAAGVAVVGENGPEMVDNSVEFGFPSNQVMATTDQNKNTRLNFRQGQWILEPEEKVFPESDDQLKEDAFQRGEKKK